MNKFLSRKVMSLSVSVVAVASIFGYTQFSIKDQVKPTRVVIAKQDIAPHTEITKDMVAVAEVPAKALPKEDNKLATKLDDVVGKYTAEGYGVPAKTFVNGSKIVPKEKLPDAGVLDLKGNEQAFSFQVNISSTHGSSLIPGQSIDIYTAGSYSYEIEDKDGKIKRYSYPYYGRIAEKVKILSVRDRSAEEVYSAEQYTEEPEGKKKNTRKKIPAVVTVAVDLDSLQYLNKAMLAGKILPVPNGESYEDAVKKFDTEEKIIEGKEKDKKENKQTASDLRSINDKDLMRKFIDHITLNPERMESAIGDTGTIEVDEDIEEYLSEIEEEE